MLRALEIAVLGELLPERSGPVLDLGCGDGFVAGLAFGRRLEAGIDLDRAVLAEASASKAYDLVCQASADRLPFAPASFALVYSNGALEHMERLDEVLAEVHRVLRPRGRFVFLVPSARFGRPLGALALTGSRLWDRVNRLHHHVNLLSAAAWAGSRTPACAPSA